MGPFPKKQPAILAEDKVADSLSQQKDLFDFTQRAEEFMRDLIEATRCRIDRQRGKLSEIDEMIACQVDQLIAFESCQERKKNPATPRVQ